MTAPSPAETQRRARLAAALRENLKRRKSQARARQDLQDLKDLQDGVTLPEPEASAPLLPETAARADKQGR